MSILDFLQRSIFNEGETVKLSGYLVDRADGLYVLGDHYPPDWNFLLRVKISNSDIMYLIQRKVSFLGGGKSSLFHRCEVIGCVARAGASDIYVDKLLIIGDGVPDAFEEIVIDVDELKGVVADYGTYRFNKNTGSSGDWLEDFDV